MHKGYKCLDISKDHIYISRGVIFSESVFPFASLNSNAGARYHSDVPLLPATNGDNDTTNPTNVQPLSSLPACDPFVQLQQVSPLRATLHGPGASPVSAPYRDGILPPLHVCEGPEKATRGGVNGSQ
jgi:hypothetical protein